MKGTDLAAAAVLLVAAAMPWTFGAEDPSWSAVLAVGCLVPFGLALLGTLGARPSEGVTPAVLVAAAAVVVVPLAGLIPAPEGLRHALVPEGTALVEAALPGTGVRSLSLAPSATRSALALAVAYVGAFLLLAAFARRPAARAAVVAALVSSGVALAVLGILQDETQRDTTHPRIYWTVEVQEAGTPFGPYVNRNHFCGAVVVLASIAAGECLALWSARRHAAAVPLGLATLVMIAAVAQTESRGGTLGVVVVGAVLLASAPAGRRLRGLALGIGVAAAVAALLAWSGVLDEYLERQVTLYGRWRGRFAVQRDALAAFAGNPVLGTGAGTFEEVYPPFQRVCDDRSFGNAHSDWAQLLMETGLLGVAATLLVVRQVVRWAKAGLASTGPARWRVAGPLAGASAVAAHGFFEVNLHVPANALLTVCALSLASAAAAGAHAQDGADAGGPAGAP